MFVVVVAATAASDSGNVVMIVMVVVSVVRYGRESTKKWTANRISNTAALTEDYSVIPIT